MAGRPQHILHGGTLKYLFGYFKIRIFYCSNRNSCLGVYPEGMHKVCCISFHVEVVLLPQIVEPR